MEISLITIISLLTVCLAALSISLFKNTNKAGILSRFSAQTRRIRRTALTVGAALAGLAVSATPAFAQSHAGGEANLILPNLSDVTFFGGSVNGHNLLLAGLVVCMLGLLFGLAIYMNLKKLPLGA